jgi:hypothetical protein
MALGPVADVRESDINLFDSLCRGAVKRAQHVRRPYKFGTLVSNLVQVNHAAAITAKFFTS